MKNLERLPSLYKKEYSHNDFEKKITSKLYIKDDVLFVTGLFRENGTQHLAIPADKLFSKKDFKRLKSIAKQIKKQKGRIRFVPLLFIGVILVSGVIFSLFFKNNLLKKLLENSLEDILRVEVSISSFDAQFFKSSILLEDLTIADKNNPMKNIVKVAKIETEFDLKELLKGSFVCELMEISGVDFFTDREKVAQIIEKKRDVKKETFPVVKKLDQRKNSIAYTVQNVLKESFESYDPSKILENATDNLLLPPVIEKNTEKLNTVIKKWDGKPQLLGKKVESFYNNALSIATKDYTKINSVESLQSSIIPITNTIAQGESLKSDSAQLYASFESDTSFIKKASKEVSLAVKDDTLFVSQKINNISSFSFDDGKNLMSNFLETQLLSVTAQYYPLVKKSISYLQLLDAEKKESLEKKAKNRSRLKGRTVVFEKKYPKFLVKNILCSGPAFQARAYDITSNQDLWGKSSTFFISFYIDSVQYKLDSTIDFRNLSTNPFIHANFSFDDFPLILTPDAIFIEKSAVPSISGDFSTSLVCDIREDGNFSLFANSSLKEASLLCDDFSPVLVSKIYKEVLQSIDFITMKSVISHKNSGDLSVSILTNVDKIFYTSVEEGMNNSLDVLKKAATDEISTTIDRYIDEYSLSLEAVNAIENSLKEYEEKLNVIIDNLNQRKKEVVSMTTSAMNQITEAAQEQAAAAAQKGATKLLKSF